MNTNKKMVEKDYVKRVYTVKDSEGNVIYSTESRDDLVAKYNIKSLSYIYSKAYFKPNIKSEFLIKVEIEKTKAKKKVEAPCKPGIKIKQGFVSSVDEEFTGDEEGEIWKVIPEYPLYSISNKGRVKVTFEGKEYIKKLQKSVNKTGNKYKDVTLKKEGAKRAVKVRVNRIIAHVFEDPSFPLLTRKGTSVIAHHKNGDTEDNRADNISIKSHRDNIVEGMLISSKMCKKCKATNLTTGEVRSYNRTIDLVYDLSDHKTSNAGYFNHAIKTTGILKGWKVEYDNE